MRKEEKRKEERQKGKGRKEWEEKERKGGREKIKNELFFFLVVFS